MTLIFQLIHLNQALYRVQFSGSIILAYCAIWYFCAKSLAREATYSNMLSVVSLASAGRYLPGGIWAALGLVGLSKRVGLTMLSIPVLFALAQGLHLLVAWAISVSGLAWFNFGGSPLEEWRSGLVCVLTLGLVLTMTLGYTRYFQPIVRHLPDFHPKACLNRQEWVRALLCSLTVWGVCGLRLGAILLACQAKVTLSEPLALGLFLVWAAAVSGLALALFFFLYPTGIGGSRIRARNFLKLNK